MGIYHVFFVIFFPAMCPSTSDLLEIAPSFILFIPSFLPLLFFVQSRLIGSAVRPKRAPVICIFVSLLGPLAAVSAAFAIVALVVEPYRHPFSAAHTITQSFLEFAYRIPVLYIIMPRSFITIASQVSLSRKQINYHGALFSVIILTTFILTVVHTSLIPTPFPHLLILALNILAALYPIPFLLLMATLTQNKRVRRIWMFITVLQLFSTSAGALRVPDGPIYAICGAFFTALWGSGVITLFYTFCSAPLSETATTSRLHLSAFSPPRVVPSTPRRVHYASSSNVRTSTTGAVISEDFTALDDPFAAPTSSPKKLLPSPSTPFNTPRHIYHPSSPTSVCSISSRPKSRPLSRPSPKGSSPGNRSSSHSPRLLQKVAESPHDQNDDAQDFLNDEALLSQVLLHSLTMKARATTEVDADHAVNGHRVTSPASRKGSWPDQRRDSRSIKNKRISKGDSQASSQDGQLSPEGKVMGNPGRMKEETGNFSLLIPASTSDKAWWSKS